MGFVLVRELAAAGFPVAVTCRVFEDLHVGLLRVAQPRSLGP